MASAKKKTGKKTAPKKTKAAPKRAAAAKNAVAAKTAKRKARAAVAKKAVPAKTSKAGKLTAAARKTVGAKKAKKSAAKFVSATKKAAPSKSTKKPSAKLTATAKKAAAKIAKAPAERESLELRVVLPASPERVLGAWLDSAEHSAFTGSDATIDAKVGGKHSAWNGYIEGEILEIQDGRRVVMSWRTTEFDAGHPDSILVVEAHPHPSGTELRVVHSELPEGGADKYGQGWREHYFAPMAKYFRS